MFIGQTRLNSSYKLVLDSSEYIHQTTHFSYSSDKHFYIRQRIVLCLILIRKSCLESIGQSCLISIRKSYFENPCLYSSESPVSYSSCLEFIRQPCHIPDNDALHSLYDAALYSSDSRSLYTKLSTLVDNRLPFKTE